MIIACPSCNPCQDPSEPTANYSSEDPDYDRSFCYGSGNGSLLPGAGYNWNIGQCTIIWGPITCYELTQEDCFNCVESAKWTCNPAIYNALGPDSPPGIPVPPGPPGSPDSPFVGPTIGPEVPPFPLPPPGPPGPPGPPTTPQVRQIYWSNSAFCTVHCPDGSPFVYNVPGGLFAGWSQLEADQKATSEACRRAGIHRVCLSQISPRGCCLNEDYNGIVTASGTTVSPDNNTWQIISGSLPPGLDFNGGESTGGPDVEITGTPTVSGNYTFEVKVTTPAGDSMQKSITLGVIEITNPTILPNASACVDYSGTLTANGGDGPYVFEASEDVPPPSWMEIASNGTISGTPGCDNVGVPQQFDVSVTDANGTTCSKRLQITLDPTTPCFTNPSVLPDGDGDGATPYASVFLHPTAPALVPGPGYIFALQLTYDGLPPGLNLNSATGEIFGTPSAQVQPTKTYQFEVALFGTCCACSEVFSITIKCYASVPENPPSTFNMSFSGANSDDIQDFDFCQRSGVNKTLNMDVAFNCATADDLGSEVLYELHPYHDFGTLLFQGGGSFAPTPGHVCAGHVGNSPSTFTVGSCTRYSLRLKIHHAGGVNALNCTSSGAYSFSIT